MHVSLGVAQANVKATPLALNRCRAERLYLDRISA